MKKFFNKIEGSGLFMFLLVALLAVFGIADAGVVTADVVNPAGGGAVEVGAGSDVSRTMSDEESVNLILDQIDKKVTKIRPYDVVLDTIARNIKDVKKSTGQVVRHYAIDTIDTTATVTNAVTAGDAQVELKTTNKDIFASEQTINVNGVSGYLADGVTPDPENDLQLYVVGKASSGNPLVVTYNGTGTGNTLIPAIAVDTVLTRFGRAAAESQISTDAYSGVPTDFEQFLQKFIAQVEVTDIFKKADKEVEWNFSDAEEEAIFDMKRTQNFSLWKGVKGRKKVKNAHVTKAEDVFWTGGIWNQAGKDFSFDGVITAAKMTDLMRTAFTGTNSGKRKLFIVGSGLLTDLENLYLQGSSGGYTANVSVGERKAAYGIEFTEYISKFGVLLVTHDQSLDDLGMNNSGFILDPDFLRKWTMGWRVTNFDLRKSAISDSDARGLMEICGLVLKNPKAHVRVEKGTVPVAVTSVALNKSTTTIVGTASETLTATISPADATETGLIWSSGTPAVATVDQTGKVTGVTAGTSVITVTTVDGGKTATCTVTVS